MQPLSHTQFSQETARHIMNAFRYFGVHPGQVLLYDDLFGFLQKYDRYHRDTMRDAEAHLRHEGFAVPDVEGLRLTETGYHAINRRR
jgi:hypothetical protein